MSEKQKEVLNKFGSVIANMSDDDLERVLLIGEGMAIMSDIKSKKDEAKEKVRGYVMRVITEVRGTPYMPRAVLAQQFGISKRTVDERMKEIKKSDRYDEHACIKDGGIVLINYLVFLDYIEKRERIRNGIKVEDYDPQKLAKAIGWY